MSRYSTYITAHLDSGGDIAVSLTPDVKLARSLLQGCDEPRKLHMLTTDAPLAHPELVTLEVEGGGEKPARLHTPSQAALREIRNLVIDLNHMAESDEARARTTAILDYLDGSEPGGEGVPVFERIVPEDTATTVWCLSQENDSSGQSQWWTDRAIAEKAYEDALRDNPDDEINFFSAVVSIKHLTPGETQEELITRQVDSIMWTRDYLPVRWRKAKEGHHTSVTKPHRVPPTDNRPEEEHRKALFPEVMGTLSPALADLIRAVLDGKEVQFYSNGWFTMGRTGSGPEDVAWRAARAHNTIKHMLTYPTTKYRIKPNTQPITVVDLMQQLRGLAPETLIFADTEAAHAQPLHGPFLCLSGLDLTKEQR